MQISSLNVIVPDFFTGPNLQAAINQASRVPKASVWIPANYAGSDTYTNPSGVPVFDMRGTSGLFTPFSPSSSAFNPGQIPGLRLWLDAQQPCYTASWATQCVNAGDAVSIWPDQSGFGVSPTPS